MLGRASSLFLFYHMYQMSFTLLAKRSAAGVGRKIDANGRKRASAGFPLGKGKAMFAYVCTSSLVYFLDVISTECKLKMIFLLSASSRLDIDFITQAHHLLYDPIR